MLVAIVTIKGPRIDAGEGDLHKVIHDVGLHIHTTGTASSLGVAFTEAVLIAAADKRNKLGVVWSGRFIDGLTGAGPLPVNGLHHFDGLIDFVILEVLVLVEDISESILEVLIELLVILFGEVLGDVGTLFVILALAAGGKVVIQRHETGMVAVGDVRIGKILGLFFD